MRSEGAVAIIEPDDGSLIKLLRAPKPWKFQLFGQSITAVGDDVLASRNGEAVLFRAHETVFAKLSGTGDTLTVAGQPPIDDLPNGVMFPYGVSEFTAPADENGRLAATVYLPAESNVNSYWKKGPTADNLVDHWYEFLFDGTTGARFNENVVTVHFADGMRGDDDLTENGVITDPGAVALDTIPWHNRSEPLDVDDDTIVAPIDALYVINYLNEFGSKLLPMLNSDPGAPPEEIDVDADGFAAPIDALLVINYLNREVEAGEGEGADELVWAVVPSRAVAQRSLASPSPSSVQLPQLPEGAGTNDALHPVESL